MDETGMAGLFFVAIGLMFMVLAGFSALSPNVLRIILAKAPGYFDEEHPKEFSRAWAKGLLIIALGPGFGGLAMYVFGDHGTIFLPVSVIVFGFIGGRLASKEVKRIRGEK